MLVMSKSSEGILRGYSRLCSCPASPNNNSRGPVGPQMSRLSKPPSAHNVSRSSRKSSGPMEPRGEPPVIPDFDNLQTSQYPTNVSNPSRRPSVMYEPTPARAQYNPDDGDEFYNDEDDADFYADPDTPPRASLGQQQHPQQLYTPAPVNGSHTGQQSSNPPSPPPILDHSHLQPGDKAALRSYERTLSEYRENAKKSNMPHVQYEFAAFMIDAAKGLPIPTLQEAGQIQIEKIIEKREALVREAIALLKKLADRGHPDSQYFLADCYANGIGTVRGRQDFDRAYPLFVLAAKHGHADAAYRSGTCCENGWGCRRESGKAVQFYRKAAAALHPGAMYRLGLAELNGELGLAKSPKEGVKWLKRSAEHSTAEFPHALHELALLHERGIDNVLFVDYEYSAELLAQSSELGYAPSAYRLGECYEYGKMGCPQDPALSIHYYVRSRSSCPHPSFLSLRQSFHRILQHNKTIETRVSH